MLGEMDEGAAAWAEAGPAERYSQAAAEVCRRLADFKDATYPPAVVEIAAFLRGY